MNGRNHKATTLRTATPRPKIRILIVDDHSVMRQGLRALIQNFEDMEVIGEATNGYDAVEFANALKPDVILMDVLLPRLDGIQATRKIVSTNPQARVLMLTTIPDAYRVHMCLQAGACGYLVKSSTSQEIFSAIRQAHAGQLAFSPHVCQILQYPQSRQPVGPTNGEDSGPGRRNQLSPRELQVLCLIADGYNNKDIASQLAISVKTVEKHRQRAMDKLNLHDVASLTRYALAQGLVQQDAAPRLDNVPADKYL